MPTVFSQSEMKRFLSAFRQIQMTDSKQPRGAVLFMDFQQQMFTNHVANPTEFLARATTVAQKARQEGSLLVWIRVAFSQGHPEIWPGNKALGPLIGTSTLVEGTPGVEWNPALLPEAREKVITKRRFSAFDGTELNTYLRAQGVRDLTLCGIRTQGVVLSTVMQASDMDYKITILDDLCAEMKSDKANDAVLLHCASRATISNSTTWLASFPLSTNVTIPIAEPEPLKS